MHSISIVISLSLLLTLIGGGSYPAGERRPDFTGTWTTQTLLEGNRAPQRLKISFQEPKLKISTSFELTLPMPLSQLTKDRPLTREYVLYTDGRGEKQKWLIVPEAKNETSKTVRVGEKFVTTATFTKVQSGREITTTASIAREVSADGNTLTETTTFDPDGNPKQIVDLYDRVGGNTRDINGEWFERVPKQLISLIVEHRDPEIKVTRRVTTGTKVKSEISTYYTDGRGETNLRDGHTTTSFTKWQNQKLLFTITGTKDLSKQPVGVRDFITWQIAKDGQSVSETIEIKVLNSRDLVFPPAPSTRVYTKQ